MLLSHICEKAEEPQQLSELRRVSPLEKQSSCDVIFVHGLGGDAVGTWQIENRPDTFWPEWLDRALPTALVYSVTYEASPSAWLGAGAMPLNDRAVNVLACLVAQGIGSRPLVFVAHSMGGLLVKQLLRSALEYGDPSWRSLVDRTCGVAFLATPHVGSDLAGYITTLRAVLRPTGLVAELNAGDPNLRSLNLWYRNNVRGLEIANRVYFETKNTSGFRVVDEASSDPGLLGVTPIPIDADHFEICKPLNSSSLVYLDILNFIRNCLTGPLEPGVISDREYGASTIRS